MKYKVEFETEDEKFSFIDEGEVIHKTDEGKKKSLLLWVTAIKGYCVVAKVDENNYPEKNGIALSEKYLTMVRNGNPLAVGCKNYAATITPTEN